MSTTWPTNRKRSDFKCNSFHFLGLLIVINYATAIEYGAYRNDVIFGGPVGHRRATTTRNILEQLNNRNLTTRPNLQDATEHLLQYGALLRVDILDTFGKLVYDKYDDFGMSQIESLYRIYHDTLERKYNIFDIVPSVLSDGDTRPTKICRHINKYVHTCLKESSFNCAKINIHDKPHENHLKKPALIITRKMYRLAQIPKYYPRGFSLHAVLQHLQAGRLRMTPALFSGLLHNVQYDNFDDKVRRSERELVKYLNTAPNTWKIPNRFLMVSTKVSELLKNYLTAGSQLFPRKAAVRAAYLSKHVVREIDAVSKNIELLGIVYDNSSINLEYLFNLVLPKDNLDQDVLEARDYLVREMKTKRIVERYLSIDKYQQNAPDQLVLDILGQLREIHFAEDLVASLYIHASYWHKSNMIETLDELLELFDAYENLRTVKSHRGVLMIAAEIKHDLRKVRNVSIEISCSRPRECLRIGLQIISNCMIIRERTRRAIASFIKHTTWGCSIQMDKVVNETLIQSITDHSAESSESVEVSMEKAQIVREISVEVANDTLVTLPQTTTEAVESLLLDYSQSESSGSSEYESSNDIEISEQARSESSEEWSSRVIEPLTTTTPKPAPKRIEKTVEEVALSVEEAAENLCKNNHPNCSDRIERERVEVDEVSEAESSQSASREELTLGDDCKNSTCSESYETSEKTEESREESVEILETVAPSTTRAVELTTLPSTTSTTKIQRTTPKAIFLICNNSDPHHQRKLHRLRKVRLVDALHSKSSANPNIIDKMLTSINRRTKPMTLMSYDVEHSNIIEGPKASPDSTLPGWKVVKSQRRNAPELDSVTTDSKKISMQGKRGRMTESQLEELREISSHGTVLHKTESKMGNSHKTKFGRQNGKKMESTVEELEEIRSRNRKLAKASPEMQDSNETNAELESTSTKRKSPKSSRTVSVKRTSWTSTNSEAGDPKTAHRKEMLLTTGNTGSGQISITQERPRVKTQKWEMTSYGKQNVGSGKSRKIYVEDLNPTGDNRKVLKSSVSYDIEAPSKSIKERKKRFRQEKHVVWNEEPMVTKTIKSSRAFSSNSDESLDKKYKIRKQESEVRNSGKTSNWTKDSTGKMLKRISIEGSEVSGNIRKSLNPEEKNKFTKEESMTWSSGPVVKKFIRSRHRVSSNVNNPSGDKYEITNEGNKIFQNSKKTSYGMESLGGGNSRGVYIEKLGRTGANRKSLKSDISYQIKNPSKSAGRKNKITEEENMVLSSGPMMEKVIKSSRRYSYGADEPSGSSYEMRKQGSRLRKNLEKSTSQLHSQDYDLTGNNRKSVKSSQLANGGKTFRREEHMVWNDGPVVKKTVESKRRIIYGADEPLERTHEMRKQGNKLLQHSEKSSYGMRDFGGEKTSRAEIGGSDPSGIYHRSWKTSSKYDSDKSPSQIEASKGFRKEKNMVWSSGPIVKKTMRSRSRYSHNSGDPFIMEKYHMDTKSSSPALGADQTVNESSRKIAITENNGMTNGMRTMHSRKSKTIRGTRVISGSELNDDDPNLPVKSVFHQEIVEGPNDQNIQINSRW